MSESPAKNLTLPLVVLSTAVALLLVLGAAAWVGLPRVAPEWTVRHSPFDGQIVAALRQRPVAGFKGEAILLDVLRRERRTWLDAAPPRLLASRDRFTGLLGIALLDSEVVRRDPVGSGWAAELSQDDPLRRLAAACRALDLVYMTSREQIGNRGFFPPNLHRSTMDLLINRLLVETDPEIQAALAHVLRMADWSDDTLSSPALRQAAVQRLLTLGDAPVGMTLRSELEATFRVEWPLSFWELRPAQAPGLLLLKIGSYAIDRFCQGFDLAAMLDAEATRTATSNPSWSALCLRRAKGKRMLDAAEAAARTGRAAP